MTSPVEAEELSLASSIEGRRPGQDLELDSFSRSSHRRSRNQGRLVGVVYKVSPVLTHGCNSEARRVFSMASLIGADGY